MDKTGKTTIYLGIMLTLVLLTSSIYIFMPDQVKLNIETTYSEFSVWENDEWVLSATERMNLFDGTAKMRAKNRSVTHETVGDITTITRIANYKDSITTIQTYEFDAKATEVDLFPIYESATCINCEGKILQFEYRDILYTGETEVIESPFEFGHNMKLAWQEGAYYAKVFQQSVASDKIIVKYRPVLSEEVFEIRLFDPPKKKKVKGKYEEKERLVPVYKTRTVVVPEDCFMVISNITMKEEEICTPEYEYDETYIDSYKKEKYTTKNIGVEIDGKFYKGTHNIDNDIASIWNIPIGDRDMELYGRCREYEIEKGVCTEVSLLK